MAPSPPGRAFLAAVIVAVSLLSPSPVAGQEAGSLVCLQGAPSPTCRGFIRIEVRGGGAVSETSRYHYLVEEGQGGGFEITDSLAWSDFGDWVGAEVGYVLNLGGRWALGGSVALETGNETTRVLVRARARRWLSGRVYADLLPGVFYQSRDLLYRSGDGLVSNTGLSIEVRSGLSGLLFGSIRYDAMNAASVRSPLSAPGVSRLDPGGDAHALSIGGGLEGPAAIIATAAALAITGIVTLVTGFPAI